MMHKLKITILPPVRFELTTPGLQDQCSNPWATEADVIYNVIVRKMFVELLLASHNRCFINGDKSFTCLTRKSTKTTTIYRTPAKYSLLPPNEAVHWQE